MGGLGRNGVRTIAQDADGKINTAKPVVIGTNPSPLRSETRHQNPGGTSTITETIIVEEICVPYTVVHPTASVTVGEIINEAAKRHILFPDRTSKNTVQPEVAGLNTGFPRGLFQRQAPKTLTSSGSNDSGVNEWSTPPLAGRGANSVSTIAWSKPSGASTDNDKSKTWTRPNVDVIKETENESSKHTGLGANYSDKDAGRNGWSVPTAGGEKPVSYNRSSGPGGEIIKGVGPLGWGKLSGGTAYNMGANERSKLTGRNSNSSVKEQKQDGGSNKASNNSLIEPDAGLNNSPRERNRPGGELNDAGDHGWIGSHGASKDTRIDSQGPTNGVKIPQKKADRFPAERNESPPNPSSRIPAIRVATDGWNWPRRADWAAPPGDKPTGKPQSETNVSTVSGWGVPRRTPWASPPNEKPISKPPSDAGAETEQARTVPVAVAPWRGQFSPSGVAPRTEPPTIDSNEAARKYRGMFVPVSAKPKTIDSNEAAQIYNGVLVTSKATSD